MSSNTDSTRAVTPPPEPYNVWSDSDPAGEPSRTSKEHKKEKEEGELSMEELIRIEEAAGGGNGGSGHDGPGFHLSATSDNGSTSRYSAQTIRQKKGRRLVSSMGSSSPSSSSSSSSSSSFVMNFENFEAEETVPEKKEGATATATTTTPAPAPAGGARDVAISKATTVVASSSTYNGGGGFPSVGLYQRLGRAQAYSAMAFGAFGFIHLVPPVLASVGGIDLANKALIWGRVYYQTYGIEQVLVYGSLAVHLGTGLCRAIVRFVWKVKGSSTTSTEKRGLKTITTTTTSTTTTTKTSTSSLSSSSAPSESTSASSTVMSSSSNSNKGGSGSGSAPGLFPYHRLVGWLLVPFVLAHTYQMRVVPVKVFGDSAMVDYSFIAFLHRMKQPAPYVLLVGLMAYHMFGGGPVAFNRALPKSSERRVKAQELIRSRKARAVAAGVISTVALVGAYRIMRVEGAIPMTKLYRSLLV
ncbi:hypothetical protein BGZ54_010391 [Gamsiella multidivaricata]|nr:hypothetical protein BGZ54_010391 [Gamsiella multidivaricata]